MDRIPSLQVKALSGNSGFYDTPAESRVIIDGVSNRAGLAKL